MDEVTKDFLIESYENLDRMDRDFVELEKAPSKAILASIFRAIHTVKGTCGFLGFGKLEKVAHAGENLLSLLRDGALEVTPAITDGLLAMVDAVRAMLSAIQDNENEGDRDDSALIARLNALQKGEAPSAPSAAEKKAPAAAPAAEPSRLDPLSVEELDKLLDQRAQAGTVASLTSAPAVTASKAAPNASVAETKAAVAETTVRVDVALLDKLMNLVGELVLSRNQIVQFAGAQECSAVLASAQHLSHVTSELQESVMKTRMQPIGTVWNKFPRLVRDLAAACKKQVRVEMEGAEIELDRTIVESIKDPLTHVVRNSVDHGIEPPETRLVAGKSAEGVLLLRAYHEGGQVNLEIADDGGGIDPDKIRNKVVDKGLIGAEQAAQLSERGLVNVIFMPGFSTAEKVTNVSGRGVGMDVVKTNIEKIGGTVDVHSKLGLGTTLKIKIPLTLAIVPALLVSAAGNRFAIPQVSVLELVRIDGDHAQHAVEQVHGVPVYRLRGSLLPLVDLGHILKLPKKESAGPSALNIVVLQSGGRQFGLVVEAINDSKDIVVKPLGKHLKGLSAFSGATILGDGKVALILDAGGISECANFSAGGRDRTTQEQHDSLVQSHAGREALVVFRLGDRERLAIPLSVVARLEKFAPAAVEHSSHREVIQYRGEIMPLVRLSSYLGADFEADAAEDLQVIVCQRGCRSVGFVVGHIVDIFEDRVELSRDSVPGLAGAAVVQGRVTDIIDVDSILSLAGFGTEATGAAA